ncbi:hypothetical protein PC116_g34337, partial [Phytophthora cactorum]
MRQELEAMIEASLELRQQTIGQGNVESERSQDVIMVDSSAPEITVGGQENDSIAGGPSGDVPMVEAGA